MKKPISEWLEIENLDDVMIDENIELTKKEFKELMKSNGVISCKYYSK